MTRVKLKEWSKDQAKKYRWEILAALLIVGLINGISTNYTTKNDGLSFTITIGMSVLGFILSVGIASFMVNIINDKEHSIDMLFKKFDKTIGKTLLVYLLESIWIFLYTLLLIVPGIIKSISYSLVTYILADDNYSDKTASEVLKLSEEMMKGHKMDFFILQLSFIGWHLLAIFTLGILEIWVLPYHAVANTKFLYDIKTEYENSQNQ